MVMIASIAQQDSRLAGFALLQRVVGLLPVGDIDRNANGAGERAIVPKRIVPPFERLASGGGSSGLRFSVQHSTSGVEHFRHILRRFEYRVANQFILQSTPLFEEFADRESLDAIPIHGPDRQRRCSNDYL